MQVVEQYISLPQAAILESIQRLNLFMAGTGSGKTHLGGIISYRFMRKFPDVRGAIFANTYDQLNTSTLFRVREYWASIGITEWSKDNPSGMYVSGKEPPQQWTRCKRNFDRFTNIISFMTGGLIFTGSLDNYMSHSGKEFGWCILDETKDTKEEAVKEVIITRLRQPGMYVVDGELTNNGRGDQQWNPLYCLTSPARVDWINEMFELDKYIDEIGSKIYSETTFFEKEFNEKKVVISSTYHNVHNVGINYINNIFATNSDERAKALVYGNPFAVTGGEFYSSFDRIKHVSRVKYDPSLPIHISFDQNSVPYNSAGISQVLQVNNTWEWRFIDEIALPNPHNSTEEVCDEFISRYPNHKTGVFFYGDASGRSRTTMSKDFKHHYEIIEFKLRRYLFNTSDRTLLSNPSVVLRRDFINRMFEGKMPIKPVIDENCTHMIADLMYCKQALDGGKDKSIVTDKETGDKYQKYGHFGDCFIGSTLIITDKGKKRMDRIRVGDKVLTRNGFREVVVKICKGIKTVNTYKIGNKKITCTKEHKIFADGIFIAVADLINMNINAIFAEKISWKERLLCLMDLNSTNIQNQRKRRIEIITKDGCSLPVSGEKYHFIDTSGKNIKGKSRKVLQFITLMVILKITELKIFISSAGEIIKNFITKIPVRNIRMRIPKSYSIKQYRKQPNGINQKRELNGINKTLANLYTQKNILKNALDAGKSSGQISERSQNGAPENANLNINQEGIGKKVGITKKESVKPAERYLRFINGIKINSAPSSVLIIGKDRQLKVYDITVEQDHEFFANGILVHNCYEYMAVELFKDFYNRG